MSYQFEDLRILIVDDNAHIRQLLRSILYAVNITAIDVAEDGQAGFDSFCRQDYDLVFTDYEMAPVSGLDLASVDPMGGFRAENVRPPAVVDP